MAAAGRGIKCNPPKLFSGDMEEVRVFLNTCKRVFLLQAGKFPSQFHQVVYTLSYMQGGHASPWAEKETENALVLGEDWRAAATWAKFEEAFLKVFGRANHKKWAANKLRKLHQANGSVEEYVARFKALAVRRVPRLCSGSCHRANCGVWV